MGAIKQILERSKSAIKSLSSSNIKTTPKITGSGAKAVSGGKVIPKASSSTLTKGFSTRINSVGKSVLSTGKYAVPVAAGIYGIDLFKNTLAHTDDYYQTKDSNANYSDETKNLKDRLKILEEMQGSDSANDGNSSNYYLKGGSTNPASSDVNSSTIPLIIGGVALAGVAVLLYKNSRRGKK